MRTHLQRLFETTGHLDPRLDPIALPRAASAVWEAFVQLSGSRRSGFGAHALTLADLEAWCRLHGVRLTSWEIETILMIDATHLAAHARSTKATP